MSVSTVTFGVLLKQFRRLMGISQLKLASEMGYSMDYISMLERDVRHPSRFIIQQIASILSLTTDQAELLQVVAFAKQPNEPLATTNAVTKALPTAPPLIGRTTEIANIIERLRQPERRLLTLTGPAGVGKTSLALHVAHVMRADFAGGVVFIDLAPVTVADRVIDVIARSLDLTLDARSSALDVIQTAVRDRPMLWVLDNFEQIASGATILRDIMSACSTISLLVTSRVRLRLLGESVRRIAPLDMASPDANLVAMRDASATQLFLERARAINAAFEPTPTQMALIASICRRLDGIPLAIELAVSRLHEFPLEAIATQLTKPASDTLDVLAHGERDRPARQQSARNAIAWSYDLLESPEQRLLRAVSLFAGPFSAEAVDAICHTPGQRRGVMSELTNLLDHHLMMSSVGLAGDRYQLFATVRDFAHECLDRAKETDTLMSRMAAYYRAFVATAARYLIGPDQRAWLINLDGEIETIRTLLAWCREHEGENGLAIVTDLLRYCDARGAISEGRVWLRDFLEGAGPSVDLALVQRSRYAAAYFAFRQQDYAEAITSAEAILAEGATPLDTQADTRQLLGFIAAEHREIARAESLFRESLGLRQKLGDRRGEAIALLNLGNLTNDITEATTLYSQSLALCRQVRDESNIALLLNNLGQIATENCDFTRALVWLEESLALYRTLGVQRGLAVVLNNRGSLTLKMGLYDQAESALEESIRLHRSLNNRRGEALALLNQANVARDRGDVTLALSRYDACLALTATIDDRYREAYAFVCKARALLFTDHTMANACIRSSQRIFTAIENHREIWLCTLYRAHSLRLARNHQEASQLYRRCCENTITSWHLYLPECLEGLALCALGEHDATRSVRLFAHAALLREEVGCPLPKIDQTQYDEALHELHATYDALTFTLLWSEGQQLSLSALIT